MKRSAIFPLILGAASFLSACGGSDDREPVTPYLESIDAHLNAFQGSLDTHSADVGAAKSLEEVTKAEDDHAAEMVTHMQSLESDLDHVAMCTDGYGNAADTGDMHKHVADMVSACEAHETAMAAAPDMAAVHMEEDHHKTVMAELIGKMRTSRETLMGIEMAGGRGMHTCPTTHE